MVVINIKLLSLLMINYKEVVFLTVIKVGLSIQLDDLIVWFGL